MLKIVIIIEKIKEWNVLKSIAKYLQNIIYESTANSDEPMIYVGTKAESGYGVC